MTPSWLGAAGDAAGTATRLSSDVATAEGTACAPAREPTIVAVR